MRGFIPLMSSIDSTWSTPRWLFDKLNAEFNFTLDVCAQPTNTKCAQYFTPEVNGLQQDWQGVCWMNPPYGRDIYNWVEKAYHTAEIGHTVVCLLPARTDTTWFHDFCVKGQCRWVRGRLQFGDSKGRSTFPSFVCVFYGNNIEHSDQQTIEKA